MPRLLFLQWRVTGLAGRLRWLGRLRCVSGADLIVHAEYAGVDSDSGSGLRCRSVRHY